MQWLKKDVEQSAVKERTLQSEKEEVSSLFQSSGGGKASVLFIDVGRMRLQSFLTVPLKYGSSLPDMNIQEIKHPFLFFFFLHRVFQLANEITTMNTSLQHQLLENSALATQTTELQQQLELKDQMISYQLIYSRNLEYEFGTIHEKLELLDQEVKTIYPPPPPLLSYRFYDTHNVFKPDVEM